MSTDAGALRIGEFARRVGVSPELLRAWEQRYELLQPIRSDGGFRLYTARDADRVAGMKRGLDEGLSAAEAARRALAQARPAEGLLDDAQRRLLTAVRAYDETALHDVLDEAFAGFALETVLRELILPALREVGDQWERGKLEIGQEHFASNLLRERLLGLARLWGRGGGPLAILACPPGERHDIGLIAFGLLLRSHGWRVLFLGADTPFSTLAQAVATTAPRLVVVATMDGSLLETEAGALRRLARSAPLALSGAGASEELCKKLRVERLDGDLVAAADAVARRAWTRRGRSPLPASGRRSSSPARPAMWAVVSCTRCSNGASTRALSRPQAGGDPTSAPARGRRRRCSRRRQSPAALDGVDVAYYLVHAMGSARGFERADRRAAANFAAAAHDAGVRRIVYLGGLGAGADLSPHLASRQEVGRILLAAPASQTIELRASIVIGSGSLSFEIVRALVERLPVMVTPRWVRTRAQPIAIEDVVAYLVAALDLDGARQRGRRDRRRRRSRPTAI